MDSIDTAFCYGCFLDTAVFLNNCIVEIEGKAMTIGHSNLNSSIFVHVTYGTHRAWVCVVYVEPEPGSASQSSMTVPADQNKQRVPWVEVPLHR